MSHPICESEFKQNVFQDSKENELDSKNYVLNEEQVRISDVKRRNDTDVRTTQHFESHERFIKPKISSSLKDRATVAFLSVAFGKTQTLFTLISF